MSNRPAPENALQQLTWRNLRRAMRIFSRIIWHVGLRSDYRRAFLEDVLEPDLAGTSGDHIPNHNRRPSPDLLHPRGASGQGASLELLPPHGRELRNGKER
jgi:hypothetical protein